MPVSTQMTDNHITAKNAMKAYEDAKQAQALGGPVTKRGTRIVTSNGEMDMNSFLRILAAEMQNLDPTASNQDSTAQVTQMAQFSSMGVMQNLNSTMTDSASNSMIGKNVIVNQKDSAGNYQTGVVNKVIKKLGSTFYQINIDGSEQEIKASNVIGVDGSDTNTISNVRSNLNSDFIAASALATNKQNVVVADLDENNQVVLVKGKVTGAFIDTVNSAQVKVKVDLLDADGNSTGNTKVYNYAFIVRAGDLTKEDMDVKLTDATGTIATTTAGYADTLDTSGKTDTGSVLYPYPEVAQDTSNAATDTSSTENNTSDSSTGA